MEVKVWMMVFYLMFGNGDLDDPDRVEIYIEEQPFLGLYQDCLDMAKDIEVDDFIRREPDLTYIHSTCRPYRMPT